MCKRNGHSFACYFRGVCGTRNLEWHLVLSQASSGYLQALTIP